VAISPDELPALLEALKAKVATSAGDTVTAMADTYRDRVKDNLHRSEHALYSKTPSPEGGFPSWINGDLARSVLTTPGPSAGAVASASVGAWAIYARVQEEGAEIFARSRRFMMWRTDYPTPVTNLKKSLREGGGLYLNFAKHVSIPKRPYMAPTTLECIDDGSLSASAMAEFERKVWA
jgi:hypothetical protein